jgi:sorbitol/mannitol transport system permease protein
LFRKYEFGEAAAAGVIVIILTIILSSFAFRLIRNLLETEK